MDIAMDSLSLYEKNLEFVVKTQENAFEN